MAIALREYCGDNNIATIESNNTKNAPIAFREAATSDMLAPEPDTLMVEVEGIHSYPFRTKNCTRYMKEALQNSQKKWTTPYLKPLIKHHNDQNGEIIGRIYDATYTEKTGVENAGGLLFTLSVPDEKAAKEVKNRILETVSIGVSANDVRCSICGASILDASEGCPHGHERGALYENEVCCWDIYDFEPKELSYVIVPSDVYAKNKRVYLAKEASKDQSIVNNITEAAEDEIQVKNGDQQRQMDLEKQLAEAQAKVAELQAELAKAREEMYTVEELNALTTEKEALEKRLAEIQALLDVKTKEVDETQAKLVISEEKLAVASQEKDAAVEAGLAAQEQLRELACKTLNQYRKMSGRAELVEEELGKRSLDSILDSILDCVEDFNSGIKTVEVKEQEEIQETEIKEQEEDVEQKLDVKEFDVPNPVAPKNETPKKTEPNKDYLIVDLSEGLEKMFVEAAKLK